ANILGIDRNQWGFCKTSSFEPVDTNKKGIFVCGSIASPKDIHDTIIEAGAAALKSSLIVSEATKDIACEEKKPLDEAEPRVGVFLCECGNEISSTLDIPSIVEYCQGLKDVYSVQSIPYLCLTEGMDAVKEKISQNTINRVVLGACVPYRYERRFKSALKSSEIDPLLVDIVNLREHVSWIHKENGEGAQNKAKALLSTSVEKMRFSEPISSHEDSIKKRALVIGGGITGVISALSIAEAGFEVDLIEKGEGLGGYLRDKRIPLEEGKDPQEFLREVVGKITSHNLATIYTHTFVESLDGYLGNFIATIKPKDSEALCIEYGAVVIATGGLEHLPSTYRYKESDRIVTQGEFEKALFEGDSKVENAQVIVMIQCVESRDEQRPYCSRVCCREAINNALYLKEKNEHASIYILNRDIMSYGFSEEYYTEARKKGIMFAKYDQDTPPEVEISGEKILVTFENIQLGAKNQLEADLLVLSTGIDPGDNSEIAQMLDLELTEDGFFKEVEPKFRPLEMLREGIYVGGLSHSPVNLSESITQGFASAQRVIALLSKKELHPGSIVARVTERKCAGCELCIAACPYSARVKDRKKGVVIVREALCQGCGSCAMVCPNSATKLVGFMDKQVVNILDNLLI
ncbi:MAG: FAD-dependent oxidoreductase, partial [Thermodesulfobacteriota bacterium]|nr:FAD-dependent oxidoreductase [Thermodesulfobacteriota bacterium]